jgi:hypothetical protein
MDSDKFAKLLKLQTEALGIGRHVVSTELLHDYGRQGADRERADIIKFLKTLLEDRETNLAGAIKLLEDRYDKN